MNLDSTVRSQSTSLFPGFPHTIFDFPRSAADLIRPQYSFPSRPTPSRTDGNDHPNHQTDGDGYECGVHLRLGDSAQSTEEKEDLDAVIQS